MSPVNRIPVINRKQAAGPRRRIVLLFSAAITLLGADLLVRRLRPALDQYNVGEYQRRPAALAGSAMPEIILLGSSRAKYALVPQVFESVTGRRAYNCSISGTKIVEWLTLSRRIFAEHKPRLVVLGVNASELRADYSPVEAARNLFEWNDLVESWAIDGFELDVVGGYLRKTVAPSWALLDQRYALKMWGQDQLAWALPKHAQQSRELRARAARPTPPDGYYHPWAYGRQLQNLDVKLLKNVADVEAAKPPAYTDNAPTFARLEQLLRSLHEQKIETLVAYLPNSPRTEARWNQVEPRIIERIAAVCRSCGAEFLPCPDADVQRSNSDFMEEIHMGLPLAQRISRRIAERIIQLGLLPTETTRIARQQTLD